MNYVVWDNFRNNQGLTIIPKADVSIQDGVNLYPVSQNKTSHNSPNDDICRTVDTQIQPTKHHWDGPCEKIKRAYM